MSITNIKLSEIAKFKKFQLAAAIGYNIEEDKQTRRCKIIGADDYIDNDFRSIDDVLKLINNELMSKGFAIVA